MLDSATRFHTKNKYPGWKNNLRNFRPSHSVSRHTMCRYILPTEFDGALRCRQNYWLPLFDNTILLSALRTTMTSTHQRLRNNEINEAGAVCGRWNAGVMPRDPKDLWCMERSAVNPPVVADVLNGNAPARHESFRRDIDETTVAHPLAQNSIYQKILSIIRFSSCPTC